MANRIQYRRDTAANWAAVNPTLAQSEPGYETDTGKRKLGDGATPWGSLPYELDKTEAAATYAPAALAEAGALMRKLTLGSADAVVTNIGDSTGQGNYDTSRRWVLKFATQLGAMFPAYSVVFYMWNNTSVAYDAPVTIQTGTGARTLTFYNGSASGQTTGYSFTNLATQMPVEPDFTFISHGHNENVASITAASGILRLARAITARYPRTALAVVAQNPQTTASASYAEQLAVRTALATFAAREGYGFIDIATAFLATPNWETALMPVGDSIHPNDAGYTLWANEVLARFTKSNKALARRLRPTGDRIYYGADAFQRSIGTPEMVYPTDGRARAGWAMDPAVLESITAVVDIPTDWTALNFYIFWTTLTAPGGLGAGVCSFNPEVGGLRSIIGQADTVYPLAGTAFAGFGGGANITETVPSSGELGWLRRRSYMSGTANAYPATRGLHELKINRNGNAGADTFPVDAVILGVLYERVE